MSEQIDRLWRIRETLTDFADIAALELAISALSHAAGQEAEPTERMVDAFHAGAGLGGYCAWVVNGLRSAMHCDPRITPAQATTNPAEIGRKSVGGEAAAWQRRLIAIDTGKLVDDWRECSKESFDIDGGRPRDGVYLRTEYRALYLPPAQPPASAEVVARAVGISRSWEGGGRTSVTFDGSFEVPLLETYRIVPVASSGRKGGAK